METSLYLCPQVLFAIGVNIMQDCEENQITAYPFVGGGVLDAPQKTNCAALCVQRS